MFDPTNVAAWTKELNRLTEAASASLSRGAEETALGELRAHFQRILDAYPTSVGRTGDSWGGFTLSWEIESVVVQLDAV